MCFDGMAGTDGNLGLVASELAETLEGMSLYAQRLSTSPECPRGMASELQLVRVALSVCIVRADALANAFDNPGSTA